MLHDTVMGDRVVTKPKPVTGDDSEVQEAISWGTAYEAGPAGAEGFFDGKSPTVVFSLATAFVIMLGVLDYFSGSRLSLSLFYLMPVGLVAWNVGRRVGFVFAVVATAVGTITDVLSGDQLGELIPIWNAGMRLAVYLALVQLLVTLHHTIQVQRDRVVEDARELSGLREMNEVKDTLLHAVSHDLKGPLAGILGAMQTLRRTDELELTPEEVESLHLMIEQSARKMNRLVDDMLDLERLDCGNCTPERGPTDIGELAQRVAAELPGMETHPVRVDADPVLVEVDPGKVERIIENLLTNAGRQHPAAGIPVHIEIRERPKGVLLVIEDEGTGDPDELKEELFEPFRQGPTAAGRGVGIGLSLVKRFAELHGGTAVIDELAGRRRAVRHHAPGQGLEAGARRRASPARRLSLLAPHRASARDPSRVPGSLRCRESFRDLRDRTAVLRRLSADDFDALYAYESREDVARWLCWGPRSADEVRERLGRKVGARENLGRGRRPVARDHPEGDRRDGRGHRPRVRERGAPDGRGRLHRPPGAPGQGLRDRSERGDAPDRVRGRGPAPRDRPDRGAQPRVGAHAREARDAPRGLPRRGRVGEGEWQSELAYAILDREWRARHGAPSVDADADPDRGSRALVITGLFGTGKSSVAIEVADTLEKRGEPYAVIDLDWLCWGYAGDAEGAEHRMLLANVRPVVGNYLAAGVRSFILARALRTEAELRRGCAARCRRPSTSSVSTATKADWGEAVN